MITDFLELVSFSDRAVADRCIREIREQQIEHVVDRHANAVRLLVSAADATRTTALLEKIPGVVREHNPSSRCPNCGSASIQREARRYQILFISMMLGTGLAFFRHRSRCRQCQHRWKPQPETQAGQGVSQK